MSQRIMVGNLPPEISEEEIVSILEEMEATGITVTLNREGDAERVSAVIEFPNIDRITADRIAERINGSEFHERFLTAYVPLFM